MTAAEGPIMGTDNMTIEIYNLKKISIGPKTKHPHFENTNVMNISE